MIESVALLGLGLEPTVEDMAYVAMIGWFVAFLSGVAFGAIALAASPLCP